MTPCPRCGRTIPDDAAFCPACGSARAWRPAPSLGSRMAEDTALHQTLILVGAIAAFVIAGLAAFMGLMFLVAQTAFQDAFRDSGGPGFPMMTGLFEAFWAILVILDVVWGVLALRARTQIQAGRVREGAKLAIIVGALMSVVGVGLLGLLVLVPGIILFSKSSPPAPTGSPPR